MIELYAQIKWVHVAAVVASGTLFALRGAGILAGARWPMRGICRYSSYAIDTVLLAAALLLATLLQQYPFVHAWLTVKVTLLVGYIVLGSLAFKRRQRTCYIAALLLYLCIIAVARAHHPLGFLAPLVR